MKNFNLKDDSSNNGQIYLVIVTILVIVCASFYSYHLGKKEAINTSTNTNTNITKKDSLNLTMIDTLSEKKDALVEITPKVIWDKEKKVITINTNLESFAYENESIIINGTFIKKFQNINVSNGIIGNNNNTIQSIESNGQSIVTINGVTYVNGKKITNSDDESRDVLSKIIINGNIKNLNVSAADIFVKGNVLKDAQASAGDISAQIINGNAQTSAGDINNHEAKTKIAHAFISVTGDVTEASSAAGDISIAGNILGNATTSAGDITGKVMGNKTTIAGSVNE